MFISVIHRVSDPDAFGAAVATATPKIPTDLKVHLTATGDDGSTVICLWEASSVDKVRDVVEAHLGHASKNEYIPIDPTKSMGLPTTAAARA
jgi:hypothetical protein